MNNRLLGIASCITNGKGFADIGTDHAYLPIYMAQHGYTGAIIASDINSMPLETAKNNAAAAGLAESMSFLLCDGLHDSMQDKIDTIVIAGMGGDTICAILDRAEWCMDPSYSLVLQPMSKAEILRYWLCCNDFFITDERLVMDRGTIYQVICARYGERHMLSDAELYLGAQPYAQRNALYAVFRKEMQQRLDRQINGLLQARSPAELARLGLCRDIAAQVRNMRETEKDDDHKF